MKPLLGIAVLFIAVVVQIGPVTAAPPLNGDLSRFVVHEEPRPGLAAPFLVEGGGTRTVADFAGRYVLVNIWASWCLGSQQELPTLNQLQQALGGEDFSVVLIASDQGGWEPVNELLQRRNIDIPESYLADGLATLRESRLPPQMGSILFDPNGREIGRIEGHTDWASEDALNLIRYFLAK